MNLIILDFFHPDICKQRQTSNNTTEVMVMCGDIVKALEDLERNHIEIDFVTKTGIFCQSTNLKRVLISVLQSE